MDFAPDDTSTIESLKLPYPYFGGKSTIMHEVWTRFGNVPNFVDPFVGGISSILTRPHANPGIETVNDLDCYVANFSRALKHAPTRGLFAVAANSQTWRI